MRALSGNATKTSVLHCGNSEVGSGQDSLPGSLIPTVKFDECSLTSSIAIRSFAAASMEDSADIEDSRVAAFSHKSSKRASPEPVPASEAIIDPESVQPSKRRKKTSKKIVASGSGASLPPTVDSTKEQGKFVEPSITRGYHGAFRPNNCLQISNSGFLFHQTKIIQRA
jgi:hypothetical protein